MDYNMHMGGVDIGDQYRGYYQVRTKSRKFYRYIFWFLLEICILNAFILFHYTPRAEKSQSYLSYRVALAEALIAGYCSRKRPGRPPSSHIPPSKRMSAIHFPAKTTKGKCGLCKESCTVWHCSQCDKRLCHTRVKETDCYLKYHTMHNLM